MARKLKTETRSPGSLGKRFCPLCGSYFIPDTSRQVHCMKCREHKKERRDRLEAIRKEEKEKASKKPKSLDGKILKLKESGISYAEAQKRETAAMFAKVDVGGFNAKREQ